MRARRHRCGTLASGTDRATSVLPVPGGPKKSTPRGGVTLTGTSSKDCTRWCARKRARTHTPEALKDFRIEQGQHHRLLERLHVALEAADRAPINPAR
jgi:hypothetical protein